MSGTTTVRILRTLLFLKGLGDGSLEHGRWERHAPTLLHAGPGQGQSTTHGPSPGRTASPRYTTQHCMTMMTGTQTCHHMSCFLGLNSGPSRGYGVDRLPTTGEPASLAWREHTQNTRSRQLVPMWPHTGTREAPLQTSLLSLRSPTLRSSKLF